MSNRILVVNTGSTSTKIGFFEDRAKLFEANIAHNVRELRKYDSVMAQDPMRRKAVTEFLVDKEIDLVSIDVIMAIGGLLTPVKTGVYEINETMCEALASGKDGVHACNLSTLMAYDMTREINEARMKAGGKPCRAYVADLPTADEMMPVARVGGIPEFTRRTLFHALNSRAMVRKYAASVGKTSQDVTVIVAHLGGGTSVSLHCKGRVIDANDALGGEGPLSPERAGTVPAFPLVEMCFSGRYSKEEIKRKLVGNGGAVAYFGTNDFREIITRADDGDGNCRLFIDAYCLSVAKYIAALAADVSGKVDAIILTGGIALDKGITDMISDRVSFVAEVVVYPGENELESLAENAFGIISGEFEVNIYDPNMSR